jgi:hypothetical protein
LRTVEHFDALDVDELHRCVLAAAVLLIARSDDVLVEVRTDDGRSAAVDTANDVFGIAGTEILELQTGHTAGESFERRLALQREIVAAKRVDRFRCLLHICFAALGRGDHDLFQPATGLIGVRRIRMRTRDSAQHRDRMATFESQARLHRAPLPTREWLVVHGI